MIAGIWRDYVRQTGALQIRLLDYRRLTGDITATDVGIKLKQGATPAQVIDALKHLLFGNALEFSTPGDIRDRTLTIFDRSFAVTYLLEAVAIVIGLCLAWPRRFRRRHWRDRASSLFSKLRKCGNIVNGLRRTSET